MEKCWGVASEAKWGGQGKAKTKPATIVPHGNLPQRWQGIGRRSRREAQSEWEAGIEKGRPVGEQEPLSSSTNLYVILCDIFLWGCHYVLLYVFFVIWSLSTANFMRKGSQDESTTNVISDSFQSRSSGIWVSYQGPTVTFFAVTFLSKQVSKIYFIYLRVN